MESDGPDSVPAKGKIPTKATEPEEDEEEDDEDDEEEYRVEKILNHGFHDDGSALYQIKWLGYNDASDRTWEPIENLYVIPNLSLWMRIKTCVDMADPTCDTERTPWTS